MYLGKTSIKFTATLLSAAILSACGSGGGGESPQTPQSSSGTVQSSSSSISSSAAVSSSAEASSSEVASSSSEVASSSSEVASSSAAPISCDVDVNAGQKAWVDNNCAACHGAETSFPTDGSDYFDGAVGDINLFDNDANPGYLTTTGGNYVDLDLPEFISMYMPNSNSPVALEVAEQITAYLTSKVGQPWCPGEDWPPMDDSSSSESSSSTAVSSSADVSSSSTMTTSSVMDSSSSAPDVPPSSSSAVPASSSSAAPASSSSQVPASSSSAISSSSVPASSSSVSSSSSSEAADILVDYTYPTQYAHLGGAASTKVVVKVPNDMGIVTKVTVGGITLTDAGNGYWATGSTPLQVSADNDQEFETKVEVDGAEQTANSLMLNNKGEEFVNKAGMTRVYSVRGLGVDSDDEIIYFTNPFDAQVYKFDATTGESTVIHQGDSFNQLSEALYWPLVVDSAMDTVYVVKDEFTYTDVGTDDYVVNLIRVQDAAQTAVVTEFDVQTVVDSARGLILDINSVAPTSGIPAGKLPTAYSLNNGTSPLMRWYLSGSVEGRAQPLNTVQGPNAKFDSAYGLAALAAKPNFEDGSILVAREYGDTTYRGKSALIEVTHNDDGFGSITSTANLVTELDGVVKPTALLYNRAGTHVYIADADRIWLMDMSDNSKTLVTSSSNLSPGVLGEGPQLGGKISAMALHPTMDYLYLAADNGGLMMVDLATGNRITVVK